MKTQKTKINLSIRAVVIPMVLALPIVVSATEVVPPSILVSSGIQKNKVIEAQDLKFNTHKQIVKEAADAARATQSALKALENDQPKEAVAALGVVSANLHLLLARDPSLGLIPIDFQVQILEGIDDLKVIKKLEDALDDLIDDKHYQAARPIVDSLVDEIRVTTLYLPIATYPAAIDQIIPLIDQGKLLEAKNRLTDTLNTFVSEQKITPLSIIRAEEKLSIAFQLDHKGDLSVQEMRDEITRLVNSANQDIKVAETLGYGTKKEYEVLYDSMDALQSSINTAKFKDEWLKIKTSLSVFKNKIVHLAR